MSARGRLQLETHAPYACGTLHMWLWMTWQCKLMLGCMVYTEHAPRQRQFYGAPTIKNQNQEEEGGGFIWRLSVHVTVHVYCVCVSDAWATLEKKKGGKTQRKQSWNELFMIVRLTAVSQFVHDVLSVCFRCLSCFGEREKKKQKQSRKKEFDCGISLHVFQMPTCPNLPWRTTWRRTWYDSPALRLPVRDASLPGCWTLQASNSAIRVGFYPPSLTLQASNSAVRAGFYLLSLTRHVNRSRFLSAEPDAAGFEWCNKSRFLCVRLMLQALNSAVRFIFLFAQSDTTGFKQRNKGLFLSAQPNTAGERE